MWFRFSETPKQLPIEPEKTPAPSKSGDFHHFSSGSPPGQTPLLQGATFLLVVLIKTQY